MRAPLEPDMFDPVCPSSLTPLRFGDKWAGMIIRCLEGGPRRFSELRVPLPDVTARTLTRSLRALERDGLVCRGEGFGYALTALGRSMLEPMDAACAWAREHWDELIDAREAGLADPQQAGARHAGQTSHVG
jgi:DNA-binding HxlR family transcriptional regulator